MKKASKSKVQPMYQSAWQGKDQFAGAAKNYSDDMQAIIPARRRKPSKPSGSPEPGSIDAGRDAADKTLAAMKRQKNDVDANLTSSAIEDSDSGSAFEKRAVGSFSARKPILGVSDLHDDNPEDDAQTKGFKRQIRAKSKSLPTIPPSRKGAQKKPITPAGWFNPEYSKPAGSR